MYLFKLKDKPEVCIEVESLIPEKVKNLSLNEIAKLKVKLGKLALPAEEFFDIEKTEDKIGKEDSIKIVFEGKWLNRVKRIGFGMSEGEILVKGNSGMLTGAFMKGGKIIVEGDAGNFSGINMVGGEIIIKGNTGDFTASGYRGDYGIKGGKIIVEGDAGNEVGVKMRGGEIIIKGNAGSFLGGNMKGGIIKAKTGIRVGAGMKNGQIILDMAVDDTILPGFVYSGKDEFDSKIYHVFEGDKAERKSKGKLYVEKL